MRAACSHPSSCPPCKQRERRHSQAKHSGNPRRQARSDALRRTCWGAWQIVRLGWRGQQKECVQMVQAACGAWSTRCAIDIGAGHATTMQVCFAPPGTFLELANLTELDGVRWASLGTGRFQATLEPIVAKRALVRLAVQQADIDDTERTNRNAVSAAVADVLLHNHRVEFGANASAARARLQTGCVVAVFADVAHHQPPALE